MAIFGCSEFIQSFWQKLSEKIQNSHLELPFLAVPNLYQSFWKNMSEKIQNGHFWPFQIYTSLFGENCQKKFGMAIFGCSEFIQSFWRKLSEKIQNSHLELPFLAVPNLYQSFWKNMSEKIQNGHFWPFQIYTSLFGENCQKKFGMAIFGHSKFFLIIFLYILLY